MLMSLLAGGIVFGVGGRVAIGRGPDGKMAAFS
jgi:hypothetical protein